jgi:hypothetical protein
MVNIRGLIDFLKYLQTAALSPINLKDIGGPSSLSEDFFKELTPF